MKCKKFESDPLEIICGICGMHGNGMCWCDEIERFVCYEHCLQCSWHHVHCIWPANHQRIVTMRKWERRERLQKGDRK